jgi:hypothetical protein
MPKGMDGLAAVVKETLAQDPFLCVGRGYVAACCGGAQSDGDADACRLIYSTPVAC